MRHLRTATLALALLTGATLAAGTAAAQDAGLGQAGLVNQGEQLHVPYAPGHTGNIVGGGSVTVLYQGARESTIIHHDDAFTFAADGTPVDTGGRAGEVVYLPPGQLTDPMLVASRDNSSTTAVQ
jgi:hypothetical protein